LVIRMRRNVRVCVGALGEVAFKKGAYVYVGSAQKNLEKRVQRHRRKEKKLFWHIDYLLNSDSSEVVEVMFRPSGKTDECTFAQTLDKKSERVTAFGCSDCRCKSHLFYFPRYSCIKELKIFEVKGWTAITT